MLFRVAANDKPHTVLLKWNPPAKPAFAVAGYNIYRSSPDKENERIATAVSGLSYVDRSVKPGTTYIYRVKAIDAAGNESPNSNGAVAQIPPP